MPTTARTRFEANASDVKHLLDIHELLGGTDPGRRSDQLQVLNKSGIVLVCAIWEAYCEDLAAEALDFLVRHVSGPDKLPKSLRKRVAKELESDVNRLAVWKLAGSGWQPLLLQRLTDLQDERNRGLNTPKADNIQELFDEALGLADVSATWYWGGMARERARGKLDEYVTLRGDIAHRGTAHRVQRDKVHDFLNHVERLVAKTDTKVNDFLRDECGSSIF
jgi:hypothetical protein